MGYLSEFIRVSLTRIYGLILNEYLPNFKVTLLLNYMR